VGAKERAMLKAHQFLTATANNGAATRGADRPSTRGSDAASNRPATSVSRTGSASSAKSGQTHKSDGSNKKKSRQAAYWSYLLGCMVNVDRSPKKHDLDVFCEQFVYWLNVEKGMGKKEWQARLPIFFELLLRTGTIDCDLPIERSVRKLVVEERRFYLFSEDQSTNIIQGSAKAKRVRVKQLNDRIDEANATMTRIQKEDDARRAKEEQERAEEEMTRAIRRARGLEPAPTGNTIKSPPSPQPSATNPQLSALSPQALSPQPSALNLQPSTLNP
jgi:hypothetical protein